MHSERAARDSLKVDIREVTGSGYETDFDRG